MIRGPMNPALVLLRRACVCVAALASFPVMAVTVAEGQVGGRPAEFRIYGRVIQDWRVSDTAEPPLLTRNQATRDLRLGLGFGIRDRWRFWASGEFSDTPQLREAVAEYRGWPVRVALGRMQEPFGLAEAGSSSDTLLMERPSVSALGPDNATGLAMSARGDRWGLTAGVFHGAMAGAWGGDREEDALTLRVTAIPLRGRIGFVHVGAGGSARRSKDPEGLRLFGSSESGLIGGLAPRTPRLLEVDEYALWNVEAAGRLGRLVWMSEYIGAHTRTGLAWGGWYLDAGWALTGERRGYSARYGAMGGVHPLHPVTRDGWGAFEVALRVGEVDLHDGGGERGRTQAVGLNWYPVDQVRLSLNGVHAERDLADGSTREADFVQARVQFAF